MSHLGRTHAPLDPLRDPGLSRFQVGEDGVDPHLQSTEGDLQKPRTAALLMLPGQVHQDGYKRLMREDETSLNIIPQSHADRLQPEGHQAAKRRT